jgi:hypothetical protein
MLHSAGASIICIPDQFFDAIPQYKLWVEVKITHRLKQLNGVEMGYVDIENIFGNQFKTNSICCVS